MAAKDSALSALDALALLRDGNRRFVSDVRSRDSLPSRARRIELAAGQAPFAAILGCSDSRRANIRASVRHLRHGSEIIEHLIQNDGLLIVGAEYSLASGEVDFFDGLEEASSP
jgi:carbonic anhydrase